MDNKCIACKQKPVTSMESGAGELNEMCDLCRSLIKTALERAARRYAYFSTELRESIIKNFCRLTFEYDGLYYSDTTHQTLMRFMGISAKRASAEHDQDTASIEESCRTPQHVPYSRAMNNWSSTAPQTISSRKSGRNPGGYPRDRLPEVD